MFTIEAVTALISAVVDCRSARRRGGRVAECCGLLNRYTVKSRIGGSNPPLSAISSWHYGRALLPAETRKLA